MRPKALTNATPIERLSDMSPNVGNFVHDLVEMAKAMETLPQVQAELTDAKAEIDHAHGVIQSRELSILDLKAEIEVLNAKLREAEVAKDMVETMFLEADDRTARALDFIKTTFGNAGSLIQALEPPKPSEAPAGVPMQAMPEAAEDTVKDVAPASPPMHEAQLEGSYFKPEPDWSNPPPQGQSESPLPPATLETSASSTVSQDAPNIETPTAQPSIDPGPAISEVKPQPYAGLRYIDVPSYISRVDWLEGGGTNEGYDDRNWV